MDGFLPKPLRPAELRQVLEETPSRGTPKGDASSPVDVAIARGAVRQKIQEMTGGDDAELEAELIDAFVTGAPVLLADLDRAVAEGDAAELRRAAHTLKSHAGVFGAGDLEIASRAVEDAAAAGRADGDGHVAALHAAVADLVAQLTAPLV